MEPGTEALPAVEQEPQEQKAPDLDSTELYANRELSWVDFNERVLELAEDRDTPLMERVKFLAIYTSNLDEFMMVRVAGLHDQVDAGIDARKADGLSPSETIDRIAERTRELGARQSREWEEEVRPALAEHGIRIVRLLPLLAARSSRPCDRLFSEQIFPVLTPLAVGPGRPFPYISNLSLSIGVWLRDPVTDTELFARVKVPKEVLPRFIDLGENTFVPLEEVIARHLEALFPGMELRRHAFFRVARDADFEVSDEADDLLRAVENELRQRRFGEVVRLEVEAGDGPRAAQLPDRAAGDRGERGGGRGGPARPQRPVADRRARRLRRAARAAVDAGDRRALRDTRRQARRVRRDARGRHPRAPPLRLVRRQRGAAGGAGRERSRTCSRSS